MEPVHAPFPFTLSENLLADFVPPRDDQLIALLNDRLDDIKGFLSAKIDELNTNNFERYKHVTDQLQSQNRDIETKHLQNQTYTADLNKRLENVERQVDNWKYLARWLSSAIFVFGAFISWISGLLEPLVKAWRALKGMV